MFALIVLLFVVISALVFVIDSSDRERMNEAFSELAKLLQEKELQGASLLIFANKQVCAIA